MNGGEITLQAEVTTQVQDRSEAAQPVVSPTATVSNGGGLMSRIRTALGNLCDEANGLELLVDEAKDRASKPWYQRIPQD